MSGYRRGQINYLIDGSGTPVGLIGRDGREWLFPAALTAGADGGASLVEGRVLYDTSDTPVGFVVYGREFIFSASFTLNTTRGYRARKHSLLINAAGVPCGVKAGAASAAVSFPVLPAEGGVVGQQPLRMASPTNKWANNSYTSGGTKLTKRTRAPVVLGSGAATSLAVAFVARTIGSTAINALGNDVLMVKAAIGLDGETVGYPITFSGVRSTTIADGTYLLASDEFSTALFASTAGQASFAQGTKFWVQWDESVTTAGMKFALTTVAYLNGVGQPLSLVLDPATFDGTFAVDNFATRTTGTSAYWTNTTQIASPLLLARFASGDPLSLLVGGDSLSDGQNDTVSNILTVGGVQRSMHNANGDANPIGGLIMALSGSTSQWLTSASGQQLMNIVGPMTTYFDIAFGANFWLNYGSGATVAAAQSSINTLLSYWYASDPKKRVRSAIARKLTPRCSYSHTSSGTNVGTTATITSSDGLVPANGASVTLAGHTPAAYNGTFTVTSVTGSTFTVTLASDPGGATTVSGIWTDLGVNSASMAYVNPYWGPIGTDPLGRARQYNNWLDTIIGDGALLLTLENPGYRVSSNQATDGYYLWPSSAVPFTQGDGTYNGGTHPGNAAVVGYEVPYTRPVLQALT